MKSERLKKAQINKSPTKPNKSHKSSRGTFLTDATAQEFDEDETNTKESSREIVDMILVWNDDVQ